MKVQSSPVFWLQCQRLGPGPVLLNLNCHQTETAMDQTKQKPQSRPVVQPVWIGLLLQKYYIYILLNNKYTNPSCVSGLLETRDRWGHQTPRTRRNGHALVFKWQGERIAAEYQEHIQMQVVFEQGRGSSG